MSLPGGMASGLAFLPTWLADTKDTTALAANMAAWARASGWRVAGFAWPTDPHPNTVLAARDDGAEPSSTLPVEWSDVLKSLLAGNTTVVWQVPGTAGRMYTLIAPPGRPTGLLWAERPAGEPWTETDRNCFRLAARLIERSAAVAAKIGPIVDPDRLQQRLQDASVIAGRMAHDFDNILTGIIGFSDLTVPLLPAGSQAAKFIGEVGKVGQRGIVFTQQLHQLSRSGQVKPHPGSVAAVVAKEEARLKPAMPAALRVVTDFPPSLPPTAMDAGPLQTVLGHLIENASDASAPGGTLTITARAVELGPLDARSYLGQAGPGAHVEVTVRDAGPGIKPDVRAKLFVEPFYTTKVRHRGLGLAIVYRVLYAHRGGIRIDPAESPGTGTVVRVVIPLAAARPAVTSPATVHSSTPSFGGS